VTDYRDFLARETHAADAGGFEPVWLMNGGCNAE
jgi:hypothetical protein